MQNVIGCRRGPASPVSGTRLTASRVGSDDVSMLLLMFGTFTGKRAKRFLLGVGVLFMLWLLCSYIAAYGFTRRSRPMCEKRTPLAWGQVAPIRLRAGTAKNSGPGSSQAGQTGPWYCFYTGTAQCRSSSSPAEMAGSAGCSVLMVSLRTPWRLHREIHRLRVQRTPRCRRRPRVAGRQPPGKAGRRLGPVARGGRGGVRGRGTGQAHQRLRSGVPLSGSANGRAEQDADVPAPGARSPGIRRAPDGVRPGSAGDGSDFAGDGRSPRSRRRCPC